LENINMLKEAWHWH